MIAESCQLSAVSSSRDDEELRSGELGSGTGDGRKDLELPRPFRRNRKRDRIDRFDAIAARLEEIMRRAEREEPQVRARQDRVRNVIEATLQQVRDHRPV